jgi:hypothetical protein
MLLRKRQEKEFAIGADTYSSTHSPTHSPTYSPTHSPTTIALLKTKKEEEELLKKQLEEQQLLIKKQKELLDKREDIEFMKDVLVTKVGFSPSNAGKLAKVLVMEHNIGSEKLFQLKVGRDISGYIVLLQLDVDGVMLVEEYFKINPSE